MLSACDIDAAQYWQSEIHFFFRTELNYVDRLGPVLMSRPWAGKTPQGKSSGRVDRKYSYLLIADITPGPGLIFRGTSFWRYSRIQQDMNLLTKLG